MKYIHKVVQAFVNSVPFYIPGTNLKLKLFFINRIIPSQIEFFPPNSLILTNAPYVCFLVVEYLSKKLTFPFTEGGMFLLKFYYFQAVSVTETTGLS